MKTIQSYELFKALTSIGIDPDSIDLRDNLYAVPTLNDVRLLLHGWNDLREGMGFTYEDESRDCDKFSRFLAAYCALVHSKQNPDPKCGFPMGEFFYTSERLGSHAINVAVTGLADADVLRVNFIEPQTAEFQKLSVGEVQSCKGCNI